MCLLHLRTHAEPEWIRRLDAETDVVAVRRENGRVGIRNHVVILPLDDLKGHYFQFAQDWRLTFHRRKDL